MGTRPYFCLENIDLIFSPNNIVLEIGSENGEGSSVWLQQWAEKNHLDFITVDVEHRMREVRHPEINWIVSESGSSWCKNNLPILNKTIKVLYLDNFDWLPDTGLEKHWIQEQIKNYANRGITMNNEACQEEHRLQFEYCLPYLDKQSVVIMDDTYYNNNVITGKCAKVIPILLDNGFKLYGTEYATRGCK